MMVMAPFSVRVIVLLVTEYTTLETGETVMGSLVVVAVAALDRVIFVPLFTETILVGTGVCPGLGAGSGIPKPATTVPTSAAVKVLTAAVNVVEFFVSAPVTILP